jgi:sugar lactone lactonase YvrE
LRLGLLALCGALLCAAAWAQTAAFSGAESTLPTTGLHYPVAVAVDLSGNAYVVDSNNNAVYVETLSGGTYTQSTLPTSALATPAGIAVDAGGSVYIADTYNSRVLKETPSGGGYAESTVGNDLYEPEGVAVDGAGNVYITDAGNHRVLMETPGAGSYTQSVVPTTGLYWPYGIAVDGAGNLYIAEESYGFVVMETLSGGNYIQSTIVPNLVSPYQVAVDANGDLYIADTENYRILKETPSGGGFTQTVVPTSPLLNPEGVGVDANGNVYIADSSNSRVLVESAAGNFGTVPVGTTSAGPHMATPSGGSSHKVTSKVKPALAAVGTTTTGITLYFSFNAPATVGSIAVLTEGKSGLDFADAGTGSCAPGPYLAGASCTVNIAFTPLFAGPRYGAAVLFDGSQQVLATGLVYGIGTGPQVNFLPGTQTAVRTGLGSPYAVAVDGGGAIYIADTNNKQVLKEAPLPGGGYTETVVEGSFTSYGVAVDGAGNVYIGDSDNNRVVKETPQPGGYAETVVASSGLAWPQGLAVDGSGNVYFEDSGNGRALKEAPQPGGGYAQSIVVGSGLSLAGGIAVDGGGTVYIADYGNNRVLAETPQPGGGYSSATVGSGLSGPNGVAVDAAGNVYIADINNNRVVKAPPSDPNCTVAGDCPALGTGLKGPGALALDGLGNLYIADSGNNAVVKLDLWDAPVLAFASTPWGSTSGDSPRTVRVENVGNAALTFPPLVAGNNPSISTGFTLSSGGTGACPLIAAGAATPGTLSAGIDCLLPISFSPGAPGVYAGSLVLTDNALNVAGAAQTIGLSGIGLQATPAINWPAPGAIQYGTPLSGAQLDAWANVPGTFVYSPGPWTVLGVGQQTLSVVFTPNDTVDYTTATATVTLTVNPVPVNMNISCWNSSFPFGADYQCQVNLSSNNGQPWGAITYMFDGGAPVSVPLGGGAAFFTVAKPPVGSHTVYVAYAAQGNFAAAAGQTEYFTVTPAPVNLQLTPSSYYAAAGSPITFTANVTSWSAGAPNATGAVSFFDGGTALGIVPVNGAGQATLTTSTLSNGTHTITATYAGGTNYGTGWANATITVHAIDQYITFSGIPSSVTYAAGLSYSLTATASSGLPVTYTATYPGVISGGALYLVASGNATVTASQPGNGTYNAAQPVTLTIYVAKAATSTALTAATLTPAVGAPDLLTATVSGAGNPGGTVLFKANGATLCTGALNAGVATCVYTPAATGGVTVVAVYQGDAGNQGSAGTLTLNVGGSSPAPVVLQAASNTLVYPGATNLTACVTSAGKSAATGTLNIYDGAAWLATLPLQGNGCAYWYISPGLAAGDHTLTAHYFGDTNNLAGTSAPVVVTVNPVPTYLSVSCWNQTFSYGQDYQCQVSVSSNAGSPQGAINYSLDGGAPVPVALGGGNAQFTIAKPGAGSHQVLVAWPQQTNYAAATPQTEWFYVGPAQVSLSMWASVSTAQAGTSISFTAQVNSWSAGVPNGVGSVTYYDNGAPLGSVPVNAAGQAVYWTSGLAAGNHTITATYNGGPNYGTASSYVNVTITQ